MDNLTLDLTIKIASVIVAIVVAFFHFKNFVLNSKTSFKLDLEIFKLIDDSNPNYEKIKSYVDGKIEVYTMKLAGELKRDWWYVLLGILFGILFCYWTYYLSKDGFSWWSIPTGYIGFSGLSLAMDAYGMGNGSTYLRKKFNAEQNSRSRR